MTENNKKDWLSAIAFVIVAALLLVLAGAIMRPAHRDYGSTWDQYLAEPEDSIDVLYLGSSFAYCDWNPSVIYSTSGLTGYVMAGSEQTPSLSYWYLKEALKTQTPQAVVMEGTSFFFNTYQSFTQVNIVYMPWGVNRTQAIFDAAEPELRTGLFFDLYFYHDRWKELSADDITKLFDSGKTDMNKGYTKRMGTDAENILGGPYTRQLSDDKTAYDTHMEGFRRIAELCAEKDIDLIVTINPTYIPCAPEVYEKLESDIKAIDPTVKFCLWADGFDEMGIDPPADMFDVGHLNFTGAYKFSQWMGSFLTSEGYVPRSQTEENTAAWQASAQYWREEYEFEIANK